MILVLMHIELFVQEDLKKSDYGNKIVTWAKAYLEEAKLLNEQATQIDLT